MSKILYKLFLVSPLAISLIGLIGMTYKAVKIVQVEAKAMENQITTFIRELTNEEQYKLWLYEQTGYNIKLFNQIYKLEECESQHISWAINPKDKDGTPSYGAFQFKTSTLIYYAKKYGYNINPEPQEIINLAFDREFISLIVIKMFQDKSVNLFNEFPVCYKRLVSL